MTGRVTLARPVLLSIPNYFMKTVNILSSICTEIERTAQTFIWGSSEATKKSTLVRWEDCRQPLSNGRLGIQCLKEYNVSFLLKLGFNLLTNNQELWVSSNLSINSLRNVLRIFLEANALSCGFGPSRVKVFFGQLVMGILSNFRLIIG